MYEYPNKSKPTQTTLHEVFRGCQIHLRLIIGRRCCISVRQYPKQRIYLQIFLHDQGCVIHLVVNLGCFCGRKKKQRSISFKPFGRFIASPPFHISLFGEADRSISVSPSPFVWQGSMRLICGDVSLNLFIIHIPFYFNCGWVQTAIFE